MHIVIDGREIACEEGEILLWVALDHGFFIPHLCARREDKEPYGACRLCFVEVEGRARPVAACSTKVTEGMVVKTRGSMALRLARTAFELILSNHPVDCAHCLKNRVCELPRIAKFLGVKLKSERFRKFYRERPRDETSPVFIYEPRKCVLCGRCVRYCEEKVGKGIIGFAYRGLNRWVTTFNDQPVGLSLCGQRGELVEICPVGAFVSKKEYKEEEKL